MLQFASNRNFLWRAKFSGGLTPPRRALTIRDWVVVRRRSRIHDRQRLQTSTLATHSNDHPDVPTPQSVRWRLQLPACQLGKVPAVTTSAHPHNATKIQGSCPQRYGEALELSQGRLEALLPSHRWIRWEIATSGHTRCWEGIPGFLQEPTFCGQTMYPTWPAEELCAMLGQRGRDPLSLLYPSPSGDCLWQNRLVLTLSTTTEAGAMGGSCQLHRLLALQSQSVENNRQTYWEVWKLFWPVPRFGKFHRVTTRWGRGAQDRRPRVHQARQHTAVRPI